MNRLIALTVVLLMITPTLFYVFDMKPTIPKAEALDPVTTRYDCYEDTDYQNGTHTQVLGLPCWVKGSPYTKWILTSYTDRVEMRNGVYGGQLNTTDSEMRYYDMYYHDIKSYENWNVEYWNGSDWIDTDIKSSVPIINTIQNDTGIFVKSNRSNSEIVLTIDYITLEGLPLKHRIELKNLGSEREFRIIQEHEIINGDNIRYGGNTVGINSVLTMDNNRVEFLHGNGTLILYESQKSVYYRNTTISPVSFDLDAKFLFGNSGNNTGLTLSTSGTFAMDTGATCTGNDCSMESTGSWHCNNAAGTSVEGDTCDTISTEQVRVGKEDGARSYHSFVVFRSGNISNDATVSDVKLNFGKIGGKDGTYSCASNCGVNVDVHVVNTDSCQTFDVGLANNVFKAPVVLANKDPDTWEDSSTASFNALGNAYIEDMLTNGTDTDLPCIGFTQTGTDVAGSTSHEFWTFNDIASPGVPFVTITITYSTTITMTVTVNDKNGHSIEKGNLKIRSAEGSGTVTFTACDDDCTIDATPDTDVTFAVQWNPHNTADNFVKLDIGANSSMANTHVKQCSSNCAVSIFTTIYREIDIEFRDTNNELHSPSSVTVTHTDNSTDKTYSTFASKGVMNFGFLAVGNSSSFRIKDVNLYGNNVVTNASATVTPTLSDQNIQHNNRVYFIDIKALSVDKSIYITPSRLDFKHSCSTVCANTTEVALTDFTSIQITNMTIDLMSMRYQGWSINQNSTDFSIGVMPTSNKTLLLTANYFKMFYQMRDEDSNNVPVIVNIKSVLANGTTIDMATTATGINDKAIYLGNSTQTFNILWQSLNISKSTQAPSASATVNIATQLKFPTGNEFAIARNNTELNSFAWHDGNSTFRVNATVSPNDSGNDQTLKIEIVDRTYANEPNKRILNITEAETGWSFADPIISDSFTMSGTTMIKYLLNAGEFSDPAVGGGGGGGSPRARTAPLQTTPVETPTPTDIDIGEGTLIGLALAGVVGIVMITGLGKSGTNKKRQSIGKRKSNSRKGF